MRQKSDKKCGEKELMIEKLGTATEVMDTRLDELGVLISGLNDEEINAAYNNLSEFWVIISSTVSNEHWKVNIIWNE